MIIKFPATETSKRQYWTNVENFVKKYQAIIVIHYCEMMVISVHTFLNMWKSVDGHTKNPLTSPLLKSIKFYLAQKHT